MALKTFKNCFLRYLLSKADLSIFSKNQPNGRTLSIKERILVSSIFRKSYKNEFANLEYCISSLPFADGSKLFGRIDFCRRIEDESIFIRGWLFSPNFKIEGLSLTLDQNHYPILAFHVHRLDVFSKLGFLNNSLNCGFVGIMEGCKIRSEEVKLGFEVSTNNNIITGTFETFKLNIS